jgi:hypothetical protein
MANLITVLVVGPVPTLEPPVALPTPDTDDPGDMPNDGICQWLYDPDTLAGAIHLDMFGYPLRCDQPATHSGILPPDPDAAPADRVDLLVHVCAPHYEEATAEGLRPAVTL